MKTILEDWTRPAPADDFDRTHMGYIDNHGLAVISVFDPAGQSPSFAYSAGLLETRGIPELIVIGLDPELMHRLVNAYARRLHDGEVFECGVDIPGFLVGFPVQLIDCDTANPVLYEDYLRWTAWYYGQEFPVRQLVWPFKKSGHYPWQLDADDALRHLQPVLGPAPA